jgi:hypothetical protein
MVDEIPGIRPSQTLTIRLPAVLIDALAKQRPRDFPSRNAWISAVLADLIDRDKLTPEQKHEWTFCADPLPRAGRL